MRQHTVCLSKDLLVAFVIAYSQLMAAFNT